MFTIDLDFTDMQLAGRFVSRAVGQFNVSGREIAKEFGTRVRMYARANASKKIYPTRDSISEDLPNTIRKETGKDYVSIIVDASYGGMMEIGTKPHEIPNAFGIKGFTIMHPGAQGYPIQHFASRAWNRGLNELNEIAKIELDKQLNKLK